MRGIGFRSGHFTQSSGVVPLVGAPGTEFGGAQAPFTSVNWWSTRHVAGQLLRRVRDRLDEPGRHAGAASPRLPGRRHRAPRRLYDSLGLRLFYANASDQAAAAAAAPAIDRVTSTPAGSTLAISAYARGNDATGATNVMTAWMTYTFGNTGCTCWTSIDLTRDPNDATHWTGTLSA